MPILLSLSLLLSSCGNDASNPSADVVARVGDRSITRAEIERIWLKGSNDSRPSRQDVLQTIIARELLAHEAAKRGLKDGKRVRNQLSYEKSKRATERLFAQVEQSIFIDEDEVTRIVKARGLDGKREVRGQHLMVATEAEADSIYILLQEGADFASLAREHSIDQESRNSGGEMGFWDETVMVGQVSQVLFSTPVGELAPPVADADGHYHIIRAVDERVIPYERHAEKIRSVLRHNRQESIKNQFKVSLKDKYQVVIEIEGLLTLVRLGRSSVHGLPNKPETSDLSRILVHYEEGAISVEKYLEWVAAVTANRRPVAIDSASIRSFASRTLVDSVLLRLEAGNRGLLDHEEMNEYLEKRAVELAIEELRRVEVIDPFVNPTTIAEYLRQNISRYTEPGLIVYEALLVEERDDAELIAREMHQGADMWTLAQGYPRFNDAWRNYDVFHVHENEDHSGGEMPAVMAAVRAGAVGDVGGPFSVTFKPRKDIVWNGHVVIKILEQRAARSADLDDPHLRNEIRRLLLGRHGPAIDARFHKFVEKLRRTHAEIVQIKDAEFLSAQ